MCWARRRASIPVPRLAVEAIGAEAPHVRRRIRLENRLDDVPADAGRAGDAVGVAAAGHDEALHARALADDEPAVGRERGPALEHAADAQLLDLRNLGRKLLGEPAEHVPIGIDRRRLDGVGEIAAGRSTSPSAPNRRTAAN